MHVDAKESEFSLRKGKARIHHYITDDYLGFRLTDKNGIARSGISVPGGGYLCGLKCKGVAGMFLSDSKGNKSIQFEVLKRGDIHNHGIQDNFEHPHMMLTRWSGKRRAKITFEAPKIKGF